MRFYDKTAGRRAEVRVGGREVPVIQGPRLRRGGFFGNIAGGLRGLAEGMRLTLATFVRPSRIVTQQYPENRATLKMYDRYRARLRLVHDEHGGHLCTSCRSCERACPNGSIRIESAKGPVSGKTELQHFVWRFDSCTFCNLCVLACPFDALAMSGEFENAVYDRRLLVFCLNRYRGPHAGLLAKVEGEEQRRAMMVPLATPFEGPVPLAGEPYPGLPAHLVPMAAPAERKENA